MWDGLWLHFPERGIATTFRVRAKNLRKPSAVNSYPCVLMVLSSVRIMHLLTRLSRKGRKKQKKQSKKQMAGISCSDFPPHQSHPPPLYLTPLHQAPRQEVLLVCQERLFSGRIWLTTSIMSLTTWAPFSGVVLATGCLSEVLELRLTPQGALLPRARSVWHEFPASLHQSGESLLMWWFCSHYISLS